MKIRLMNPKDYAQLYKLWLSCEGMGLNDYDDSEDGVKRFLARNPETCFVAEDENNIIGAIMAGSDGRRGYIYHTAVSPLHRHKGIASALLDKALTALSDMGIAKAALVVFSKNADGNAFWEQLGFISRDDLVYRNKPLKQIIRIDT